MAENITEREYVIPLRRFWLYVPQYDRTSKAVKAIKNFVAKHMKIPDRDVSKVKLDVYFNNELWFKGRANPPAKIKVKVKKEGDIVKVDFIHAPEHVKHLKSKHGKFHKVAEKKETPVAQPQKTENEKEKESATAEANAKEIKQEKTAEKHTTSIKEPSAEKKTGIKK